MISYDIVFSSRRKTIAIQVKDDASVRVSAPIGTSTSYIEKLVQSKSSRIQKKIALVKNKPPQKKIIVTREMKHQALIQFLPRIEYYADLMNLSDKYSQVKITTSKSKRGSCSSKGVLMFHWKLTQVPLNMLDYVIVHELAHLLHFNHSPVFWNLVADYYPRYLEAKTWFKSYSDGTAII